MGRSMFDVAWKRIIIKNPLCGFSSSQGSNTKTLKQSRLPKYKI